MTGGRERVGPDAAAETPVDAGVPGRGRWAGGGAGVLNPRRGERDAADGYRNPGQQVAGGGQERSLPGSRPPWKVPPPPGRTELRCTWVHLVPRPCCTIEGSLRPSTDAAGPPTGADALRGVVRVYKPFLACHSRPGRQCLLTTLTGPGLRDHLAAIVRVYWPGHQATGTWTSTDEAFQSSQREKTPSGSGESLLAFACLPLPVRSPMPAGDTNAPWSL
ncbi:hypothetical protein MRX96_018186 [Rhipicephalus microplus]